ncbi:MAG: fatty acid desaturase [Archangium sp.]|nr:fatty acid desaturase [Archangium sp.]
MKRRAFSNQGGSSAPSIFMKGLSLLTTHPISQFKRSPRFYFMYDGFWLLACAAALLVFWLTDFRPIIGGPSWWFLPVFPLLLFCLIWAHLLIHNATHGSLPKAINRIAGEVLGVIVVVRFASWDIVHMRHHKYSDDRTKDPHPNFPSFWKTVAHTVVNVEKQLFQQYYDVWGDTAENHRRERRRANLSYGTNLMVLAAWWWLLGPAFMLLVFLPCNALAGLFVIHFNWSTHNGEVAKSHEEMCPVNLSGPYYRLGNKLFAGIYAHRLHHDRPTAFNPARALASEVAAAKNSG